MTRKLLRCPQCHARMHFNPVDNRHECWVCGMTPAQRRAAPQRLWLAFVAVFVVYVILIQPSIWAVLVAGAVLVLATYVTTRRAE